MYRVARASAFPGIGSSRSIGAAPTWAATLHLVGGPHAEAALRSLGWEGRFLVIGFATGEIPKLALNLVLLKSCDVRGVFWGAWVAREPDAHRANTADLLGWCAAGKISAHVHAVFSLDRAAEALHALADRAVMGKLVLRP